MLRLLFGGAVGGFPENRKVSVLLFPVSEVFKLLFTNYFCREEPSILKVSMFCFSVFRTKY